MNSKSKKNNSQNFGTKINEQILLEKERKEFEMEKKFIIERRERIRLYEKKQKEKFKTNIKSKYNVGDYVIKRCDCELEKYDWGLYINIKLQTPEQQKKYLTPEEYIIECKNKLDSHIPKRITEIGLNKKNDRYKYYYKLENENDIVYEDCIY